MFRDLFFFYPDPFLPVDSRRTMVMEMDMRIISRTIAVVMCTTIINFKGNEVYVLVGIRTGWTPTVAFLVTSLMWLEHLSFLYVDNPCSSLYPAFFLVPLSTS